MPDPSILPYITASIVIVILALIFFTRRFPKIWPLILFAVTGAVIGPLALMSYAAEVRADQCVRSLDEEPTNRAMTADELSSFDVRAIRGVVFVSNDGSRQLFCIAFSDGRSVALLEASKGSKREPLETQDPCPDI